MTIGGEAIWDWLKKAPLPVVLALGMLSTGTLGTWLWAVETTNAQQETRLAIAEQKAAQAVQVATSLDAKLEKANDKLDKLLELVIRTQAEKAAEDKAKAAAAAKKKENH